MNVIHIDCDRNFKLPNMKRFSRPGVLPRKTRYGDAPELIPFGEAHPDKLIDPKDYKEVIAECHAKKIFPIYHQRATWAPPGVKWNQNGLNYCWSWAGIAAFLDLLAREGKPTPLLSPVTMGRVVGWRNVGNYLEHFVAGLKKYGVAEMRFTPDPHSLKPRTYLEGWEDNALEYRLAEAWDTRKADMVQHALSILATGTPGYAAWNHLGHAMEVVSVEWDERQVNNLRWIIRNSHNEPDVIVMTGRNAVPDELIGLRASVNLVEAA